MIDGQENASYNTDKKKSPLVKSEMFLVSYSGPVCMLLFSENL